MLWTSLIVFYDISHYEQQMVLETLIFSLSNVFKYRSPLFTSLKQNIVPAASQLSVSLELRI
jgi:hypothetical protein